MNPLLPKIAVGTLALSTIGTGAYFGGKELFRAPTIEEQLNKVNFKFIKDDDTAQWNLEFESDSTNIKKVWGDSVNNGTALMQKCKSKKALDSEKEKANVMKWCGIRSISSQLERKGKKYLVTLAGTPEDIGRKWTATYNKRKDNQTNRGSLGLTGEWPSTENEIDQVKELCKNKGDSDFLAKDSAIYTAVENWCTEEGANVEVPKA